MWLWVIWFYPAGSGGGGGPSVVNWGSGLPVEEEPFPA